jgi:uncharacterized cupin superfamily protein
VRDPDSLSPDVEHTMAYRVLHADDAYWRRSNQMGVLNTDLGRQLDAQSLGARFWRVEPGQASTRHRHRTQVELYVLLEGTGRIRIDDELLTVAPLSAVLVEPASVRQLFNDTDADQLWLIVGAPPEAANTLEMTEADIAWYYPDGPKALPPELS